MTMRGEQFRYLALAILLAIGAGLAWGLAGGWGTAVVNDIVLSGKLHEQLLFCRDGTPVIETYGGRYESRSFRKLDGTNIEVTNDAFRNGERLQGPEYQNKRFTGLRWNERIVCAYNDWYGPEVWYFVHDGKLEGHGYFVGYDKIAKATIGYIGCDGFRPNEPPLDQQFAVDGRRMSNRYSYGGTSMIDCYYDRLHEVSYLLADDGLRTVNVKKRTVTLLRKGSDLISGAMSVKPGLADEMASPESKTGLTLLLRTADRVVVLTADGTEIENYSLPPELREDFLQWFALPDGKVLVYRDIFGDAELSWLERGGKTVRHEHLELLHQGQSQFMKDATLSVIVPSPATIAG